MKKTLYGFYVIWLGLLVKTIKKKNAPFQMKFLQAAMKFSSMVLVLSLITACSLSSGPASNLPITNTEPVVEVRGNWKAGVPALEIEKQLVQKEQSESRLVNGDKLESQDNVIVKNIPKEEKITILEVILGNNSFEEPILKGPILVVKGQELPGWIIDKGDITLVGNSPGWFPPPEAAQSVSINGKGPGKITQNIKTVIGREYKLEFYALAGEGCTPEESKIAVIWNNEERVVLDLNIEQWSLYEVTLESQMKDNFIGFETKSTSACGSGVDNIKLSYEDDGIIDTTKVDATDSIESLKLELQKLLQDLRNDPLSTPQVPTSTPTLIPPVELIVEPTPTSISQLPTPTPTPQLDITPVPIDTITSTPIAIVEPTLTPIPEETATPTPTPKPTSKYDIPQQATETTEGNVINFSGNPKLVGDVISFSGTILTKEEPLAIQIWNLQGTDEAKLSDSKYDSSVCSTEKPAIFFREPPELGYAYIENSVLVSWVYCLNTYEIPNQSTVSWVLATTWLFNEVDGHFTFEGNKLGGTSNEYQTVSKYVLVVIGPKGVMARKEVN